MQELSLNILDITMNGITAGADTMRISIEEAYPAMTIRIQDNGCGLDEETLDKLRDPFFTSRTTRKVGMGVPLFEMQAEMTGGNLEISSVEAPAEGHGTTFKALFYMHNINFVPLGDMVSTLITLIQGNPNIDFIYHHHMAGGDVDLDMREVRETLGDVPVNEPDILLWLQSFLEEQYEAIKEGERL